MRKVKKSTEAPEMQLEIEELSDDELLAIVGGACVTELLDKVLSASGGVVGR